mgnify:CR=1 FL=1|jgi:hypothetical protein
MKKIVLSENEVADFKTFCLSELDKAHARVRQLQAILNRLGADVTDILSDEEDMNTSFSQSGLNDSGNEFESPKRKKNRRKKKKVKWADFILNTIRDKGTVMLANEIIQAAYDDFEVPDDERQKVRMSLSSILTRMLNQEKVLRTYAVDGIRGRFYGVAEWFNEKEELNADIKSKLIV